MSLLKNNSYIETSQIYKDILIEGHPVPDGVKVCVLAASPLSPNHFQLRKRDWELTEHNLPPGKSAFIYFLVDNPENVLSLIFNEPSNKLNFKIGIFSTYSHLIRNVGWEIYSLPTAENPLHLRLSPPAASKLENKQKISTLVLEKFISDGIWTSIN